MVCATGEPERTTRKAYVHAARTTARARLRPSAGCTTEELYHDREFSIAIGVFEFHVATWSRVS